MTRIRFYNFALKDVRALFECEKFPKFSRGHRLSCDNIDAWDDSVCKAEWRGTHACMLDIRWSVPGRSHNRLKVLHNFI